MRTSENDLNKINLTLFLPYEAVEESLVYADLLAIRVLIHYVKIGWDASRAQIGLSYPRNIDWW